MTIAHIRADENGKPIIQTLKEHIKNTAVYTAENLHDVQLYNTGYLAGLLHDMGKATKAFDDYITASFQGEKTVRGSINHTFAGVIFLSELTETRDKTYQFVYELIAYAIGSHHGLFDAFSPEGVNGFLHRTADTDREEIFYNEAKQNFLSECADMETIEALLTKARDELLTLNNKIKAVSDKKQRHRYFLGLSARLLTSALIDADRRDTAEFFGAANRIVTEAVFDWCMPCTNIEKKISAFKADTPVNIARKEISDICKSAAANKGGIYRLTVPTGAGKTLSVTRYAAEHCRIFNKKHIIYTAPLLTIIEQNAEVIRNAVGKDYVLEHHSNIVKSDMTKDELSVFELLSECWDSPITVTTMVQLLNTLFDGSTSCVRRMQSLANSVIIIDEIQSLPINTISMMNGAVNFLADICNTTVVLCSATQPSFEKTTFPLKYAEKNADIVPFSEALFEPFKRTQVINKYTPTGYSDEQIAELCEEKLKSTNSVLLIGNTKNTAKNVFDTLQIKQKNAEKPFKLFHLSASMCRAHRGDMLNEIKSTLGKEPLICISTQIIEAGVDISFESVIRILAGMDNIAQAAGRCNRNFDFGRICEVDIIKSRDEKLTHLKDISHAQTASLYTLNEVKSDFLSEQAIKTYYKRLYNLPPVSNGMDYSKTIYNVNTSLLDLLSDNNAFTLRKNNVNMVLNQAFKTAGKLFQIFDENTTDVLVPYNEEAEEIITSLTDAASFFDLGYVQSLLARAKPFTVSVYEYTLRMLEDAGAVTSLFSGTVKVIDKRFYNSHTGLTTEKNGGCQTAIF